MRMHLFLAAITVALLGCSSTGTAANPVVVIETSLGTIKAELNEEKAPTTVKNFLRYVDDKHFDNTVFHRVIPTFMIQGGGFKTGMDKVKTEEDFVRLEKPTREPIKLEVGKGLSNLKGTLAMARTGKPDSATAQFFINVKDNIRLDTAGGGYAVFGKVIEGMDVVDKIKDVKTRQLNEDVGDIPVEDVVIKSIRRAN